MLSKRWLYGVLNKKFLRSFACLGAFTAFLPSAEGKEILVSDQQPSIEYRAEYSWRDFSKSKEKKRDFSELEDKDATIRSHRLGVSARAFFDYFKLRLAGGVQKVHVNYRDPQYNYFFRDLELGLEGDLTPYLGFGAESEIHVGSFGFGFFGYREESPRRGMNVESIDAKLADDDYSPGRLEEFGDRAVSAIHYRLEQNDLGLSLSYDGRFFDVEGFLAYSWLLLEMDVDYSAFGEYLIRNSDVDKIEVREGNFRNYLDGFYVLAKPTVEYATFIFGGEAGFIRVDDSYAYILGVSFGKRFYKE